MHTTALCSPSRSCILTGRNHHSNAMSCITEGSTGYPGGNGYIPFENGMLSDMLLQHGYNTYAFGKWHLTPADQASAAGPYDRWPLGRGFERYYGFLGGDTHQYYPELVYDKYDVLPVDSRGQMRALDPRPQIAEARTSYTLYPDTQMVPGNAGPNVMNRPYSITSDVEIPKGGAEGVLLSAGDVQGGYSFYVQGGKLHYVYSYVGSQFFHIESNVPVPVGRHKLRFEFETTGPMDYKSGKGAPGHGKMFIDGKPVGQGDIPLTMAVLIGLAGGTVCGANTGSPVWDKYEPPFKFTGTLYSATVDVSGELIKNHEAEMRVHLARQ